MRSLTIGFLILGLCVANSTAFAATYLIKPDGSGDFPTIQDAVTAASNGDSIELANGIFNGIGNYYISYAGKAITIRSQGRNPNLCVIDCETVAWGFLFDSGEGAGSVLEGITIVNAYNTHGAAVHCAGTSPTIRNCILRDNEAWLVGGAIYCYNPSSPTIVDCTISDNVSGNWGGGIACFNSCSPLIEGCTITGNIVPDEGGGIHCRVSCAPTIRNCTISGNRASGQTASGGGICCEEYSAPTIEYCTISGNSSFRAGGGMFLAHTSGSHPSVTNCTITGNQARYGAGIHANLSSPTFTSCTISGNSTTSDVAGGIFCKGSSSLAMERSILWGNCAATHGDEVYFDTASGAITFLCCDVNSAGIEGAGTVSWLYGNIFTDPLFCNPEACTSAPTTAGDYTLHVFSPCTSSNSPEGCGLIGALPVGCCSVPIRNTVLVVLLIALATIGVSTIRKGRVAPPR